MAHDIDVAIFGRITNTFRVYLFVVANGPVGVREVQKSLGLSNPSLAMYHIQTLADAGLLTQDSYGRYRAELASISEVVQNLKMMTFMLEDAMNKVKFQ